MEPSETEIAAFEAGIKLGTLYHQFVGTPLDVESADGLAAAMAEAIANQPACVSASVELDRDRIDADTTRFGYTELAGAHIDATVVTEHGEATVTAGIGLEDGYPMMRIEAVEVDADG